MHIQTSTDRQTYTNTRMRVHTYGRIQHRHNTHTDTIQMHTQHTHTQYKTHPHTAEYPGISNSWFSTSG